MMSPGEIVNLLKLSPKYLIPVGIVASCLLFLPHLALSKLGLVEVVTQYRMWIGLLAVTTYALLASHVLHSFWARISPTIRTRKSLRKCRRALTNLTSEEKEVLIDYIIHGTKSRMLNIQNGVHKSLEDALIICRASNVGIGQEGSLWNFAFNLQPWAWEELNSHRELLEPELSRKAKELGL